MKKDEIDKSIMNNNSNSKANYIYCNSFDKDKQQPSKYDSFIGWLGKQKKE